MLDGGGHRDLGFCSVAGNLDPWNIRVCGVPPVFGAANENVLQFPTQQDQN